MVKGDNIIERLLAAELCIVNLAISLPSCIIEVIEVSFIIEHSQKRMSIRQRLIDCRLESLKR